MHWRGSGLAGSAQHEAPARARLGRIGRLDCLSSGAWVSNWQFSRGFPDWATLRGARRLTYADSRMKNLLLSLLHLAVMTAKLCGPGGVRAVIAENLVLSSN